MFKKSLILFAVSAILFSASAQNARVQSMGGCDIFDDITRLIPNPAYLNDYADQVQATAYSGTSFGPAIGIKSLGSKFNVGLLALPIGPGGSSVLGGDFYLTGRTTLGTLDSVGNIPTAFPTIPHLLFGIDLGSLTLGLDFFFELTKYRTTSEQAGTSPPQKTEIDKGISNVGGVLSANISLGKLFLSPLIGIGMPRAKGTAEITTDTTIINEVKTEKGLFFTGGLEVGLDVNNFTFRGGGFFRSEPYQFMTNTTKSNEFSNSFFDGYIGLVTEVLNGLLLVSQYNFSTRVDRDNDINDTTGTNYKDSQLSHGLRLGLEKPIEGVWIFDEITPRAGFSYNVFGAKSLIENSGGPTNETNTNNANTASQVRLTTGLGVSKGIAAIDLAVVIGSWSGVLTGPSVVTGTLTLDFGKSGSSSLGGSSYEPAPSPVFTAEEPVKTKEPTTTEEPVTEEEPEKEAETDSSTDFDF